MNLDEFIGIAHAARKEGRQKALPRGLIQDGESWHGSSPNRLSQWGKSILMLLERAIA